MEYPIPGYLEHPADLAGNMLAGFHAGAAVAGEQARLDQQAQQAGIQIAERKQQMQIEQLRQQQQLEMTKAYHEAQIGLRKSQLEQAQQKIQLATMQAAHKFQSQMAVQKRTQELTAGGMPIDQATRQAFLENASNLGMSGQGVAALTKPPVTKPSWVAADPQTGAPAHFETPQGAVHIPAQLQDRGKLSQRDVLQTLRQQEKELAADPLVKAPIPAKADEAMKAEAQRRKDEYKSVRDRIARMMPDGATLPAGLTSRSSGKVFTDKSGKRYRYTGSSTNPATDKDPDHWEEVK